MPGTDELSLFSRHGMANNGWHRFRVPLRPSFNSIRLKVGFLRKTAMIKFLVLIEKFFF
jgi:hypothetical protein